MQNDRSPIFMLGIGCQKAGTSWLYDFLKNHDGVFLPTPKELHVFDAMYRPDLFAEFYHARRLEHAERGWRQKLRSRMRREPKRGRHLRPIDLVRMIDNPSRYREYFVEMAQQAKVVGEITPSYAALSGDDLRQIRDLMGTSFNMKIIVLLRDPVDRAFSAVRHFRRVNANRFPHALRGDDNALFERLYDTPYIWERADYPRVIEDSVSVFGRANVHVEFFERLFTQAAVRKICDFLRIAVRTAEFEKVVNPSPKPLELDEGLRRRARSAYSPIYDYCVEKFPDADLARLWQV